MCNPDDPNDVGGPLVAGNAGPAGVEVVVVSATAYSPWENWQYTATLFPNAPDAFLPTGVPGSTGDPNFFQKLGAAYESPYATAGSVADWIVYYNEREAALQAMSPNLGNAMILNP